jgi:hypothetical protein
LARPSHRLQRFDAALGRTRTDEIQVHGRVEPIE